VAKRTKASTKRASAAKPKARAAAPKKGGAKKRVAAKKSPAKKAVAKKAVAKKVVAKKSLAKKAASAKPAKAIAKPAKPAAMKRRDGAGHLDPKYAADLRARARPKDNERAFGNDALSRELGGEFVETVTSGEDEGNEVRDMRVTEELGGPFTVTTGGTEYADGVDGSNPKRATREPFPRT
jgi:hypothetical protein